MTIEKMLPSHIDGVKALLDNCFGDSAWSLDSIRSQLEKPDSICLVGIEDDSVIAYLAFEQIADEGNVIEVAVHPDHRRRGIARRMLEQTIDSSSDLYTVFLEVRESNAPAISLYESLGFERAGTRRDYYDRPKENAVTMMKKI